MIKRKKTIFLVIAMLAFVLVISVLAGCSKAPTDDTQLRKDGYLVTTFDCNGGSIGDYAQRRIYALPGSKLLEPGSKAALLAGATLDDKHELEGWFTGQKNEDGTVTFDKRWDFQKDSVAEEVTLYARWIEKLRFVVKGINTDDGSDMESAIKYVSHYGSDSDKTLQKPAATPVWTGNTFIEYYADETLETPFTFPAKHNGDKQNNVFMIYARYVSGEYKVARTVEDMVNIGRYTNLFVLNDIDMSVINEGDPEVDNWSMTAIYSGTIRGDIADGNIKQIKNINFKVSKVGTNYNTTRFGLFGALSGATFDSIAFVNCTVTIEIPTSNTPVFAGMLAGEIESATFNDFSISGNLKVVNQIKNNPELLECSELYGTIESTVSLDGCEYEEIILELIQD